MPQPSQDGAEPLPESASLLLDVIRFVAALLVVAEHFTYTDFGLGYRQLAILGEIAVPVFFVLSGFVIRYVTRTRETSPREYFIDRASRIYSVVLPSIAVTLLAGWGCALLDPARFARSLAPTFNHPLVRLLVNLAFFNQAWGRNTIPFNNVPFWSLGFECVYYVLYAFAFYWKGWRRALPFLALSVAIGPQVMFLLPVWWSGCWLYDLYQWLRRRSWSFLLPAFALGWFLAAAAFALLGSPTLLKAPLRLFFWIAGLPNPLTLLGQPAVRATMTALAVGLYAWFALLLLLLASEKVRLRRQTTWGRAVRQIANGTFSIYLMHYPLLILLIFAGIVLPGRWTRNAIAGVALCALLTAAAVPLDALKTIMRRWLRRRFPARNPKAHPAHQIS